jgi:uncharacterized protein (DUF2126 family)
MRPEEFPQLSPQTTAAWNRCAEAAEALLQQNGLVLTQGGEPTLVPDEATTPEWNVEALGPEKLDYARRVGATLLRDEYPGSFLVQTFGKQYPGEALPRWNLVLTWSKSGTPLWSSPERLLLADKAGSHAAGADAGAAAKIARIFGIKVKPLPAFEVNSGEVAGYVLPLDRIEGEWTSDKWPFTPKRPITLIPGDSPVGLRLPLAQVPETALRRALSVQIRRGALEIFIPPLDLPSFIEFAARIEALAVAEDWKDLVFVGYRPYDPDETLLSFGLAADPGVLEANLPVCQDWNDYRRHIRGLFKAGEAAGMRACKYRLNGQVNGTGGGSHVVFGGPTAEMSPFLQNPGLLASVIRFWQHHPALSYAFAGTFIGPDSQHPRGDESARCKITDLEIACRGLEKITEKTEKLFMQVDRTVRDLLIDRVGNTHRAEICVDKLWNPEAPNGSCGLLEFRAFESLPSADHQALVGLFLRGIIAALNAQPFREAFLQWKGALHDAYLLPWFLRKDVAEICRYLRRAGIPFREEWLDPVLDFRFPLLGKLTLGPHHSVEMRQAGELFPTLGERGTSRPVDVSTDRLEVRLVGPATDDFVVGVNGVHLPLKSVGKGVSLAGLRFKKAELFPGLAPHLPAQVPLHFTVTAAAKNKLMAEAVYHTWNPETGLYAEGAVTPEIAERRRAERWQIRQTKVRKGPALERAPSLPAVKQLYTTDLRLIQA